MPQKRGETMGKGSVASRELAKKLEEMDSICFREPIYDVHGVLRKRLFANEAQWRPAIEAIHVDGPPSSGLILAPGQAAPQPQAFPEPVWKVTQVDLKSGHAFIFTVPLAGAHSRAARRVVEDGDALSVVSIAEFERRKKDAALATGSAAVQ